MTCRNEQGNGEHLYVGFVGFEVGIEIHLIINAKLNVFHDFHDMQRVSFYKM